MPQHCQRRLELVREEIDPGGRGGTKTAEWTRGREGRRNSMCPPASSGHANAHRRFEGFDAVERPQEGAPRAAVAARDVDRLAVLIAGERLHRPPAASDADPLCGRQLARTLHASTGGNTSAG